MKHLAILISILGVSVLLIFSNQSKTITDYESITESAESLADYGSLDQGDLKTFNFIENTGTSFSNANLAGNVWLIHTFFTHCGGICPTLIGDIKRLLGSMDEKLAPSVLSVSVDPERDTPARLSQYRSKHDLNSNIRWHMVTGKREELTKFADLAIRLGFPEKPDSHSPRVVLLDRKQHVRGFYNISESNDFARLRRDVLILNKE